MQNIFDVVSPVVDISRVTATVEKTYSQYQTTVITAVVTATLLLIALAWNDVVQTIIEIYYPKKDRNSLQSKLYYAITITIIVIIIQLYIFPYITPKNK